MKPKTNLTPKDILQGWFASIQEFVLDDEVETNEEKPEGNQK